MSVLYDLERDASEWVRRPMRRSRHTIDFDLGGGVMGGIMFTNTPRLHAWDGARWVPPDFHKEARHVRSHGIVGSAGVLDRTGYRPLWRPGPLCVRGDSVRQTVGPFEASLDFDEGGIKQSIILQEPTDFDLAFECDPCGTWLDAAGRAGNVKRVDGCDVMPASLLHQLAYPVLLDPELCLPSGCKTNQQDFDYADAHDAIGTGQFASAWGAYGPVGQQYSSSEPNLYFILRALLYYPSTGCGDILTAEMKFACHWPTATHYDDYLIFKRADGTGLTCSNAGSAAMAQAVYNALGTTRVLHWPDLDGTCSTTVYNWSGYTSLAAADIAHLNNHDGLGGNLYFGLESEEDLNSVPPADLLPIIYLKEQICMRYTAGACGGYVWLVGG